MTSGGGGGGDDDDDEGTGGALRYQPPKDPSRQRAAPKVSVKSISLVFAAPHDISLQVYGQGRAGGLGGAEGGGWVATCARKSRGFDPKLVLTRQTTGTAGSFIAAKTFTGSKEGYVFKAGPQGTGYYSDNVCAPASKLLYSLPLEKERKGEIPPLYFVPLFTPCHFFSTVRLYLICIIPTARSGGSPGSKLSKLSKLSSEASSSRDSGGKCKPDYFQHATASLHLQSICK